MSVTHDFLMKALEETGGERIKLILLRCDIMDVLAQIEIKQYLAEQIAHNNKEAPR